MSSRGSPATQALQPPKPPPVRSRAATRRLTSSFASLTTGCSKEDMLSAPAFSTSINSPESASKYLADHFLLMTNQDLDHSSFSHVLLHLTFTSSITAPAVDAIRAIVILSDSLIPPPTAPAPTTPQQIANPESLESQISLGTYVEALCKVTALNTSSASVITRVIDDVKDDLHNTVQYMSTTADELVEVAKNTPSLHPTPPPQAFSYADATKQKLPTIATAKCLAQTKMVRISPPLDNPSASLKDLDEDVLVQKANTTLELVHIDDPTIPEEAQFISARKTNHSQVLYEVDSSQTADWLHSPDGAKAFTSKFRPNITLTTKPFPVLIEYVPICFNTDDPSHLRDIKHKNALPTGAVKSARWIKPIERRSPQQWRAHLTLEIAKPGDANQAIREGLVILGPRCPVRKLLPEPIHCMKCQSFEGSHFARDCKRTDDTCGTCAGNHRTKDCKSTSLDQHRCANCQEVGHVAWDRECLVYLEKARQYQSHIADARYRFYPEREDPTTWELDADTDHQWTPTDQQDNHPQDRQPEDYIEERWETAGHR